MIPLVSHPEYSYPFDARHRFPMAKFGLLNRFLEARGILQRGNLFRPGRVKPEVLALAHCPRYIQDFSEGSLSTQAQRRMGLPWSPPLVKRSLISPNGTLLTALLALHHGVACHLAGGTHHAHHDFASGYCIFNDLAVTALALLAQKRAKRILIFDCDVHQGDGTARILEHEARAFTCSVHCEKNFPTRKARSDLDINLAVDTGDEAYLESVDGAFQEALNQAKPDLVLYDAGVDVFRDDPLGRLNISLEGIRDRDRRVLARCQNLGIPVATVIGGGYDRDQQALAERHAIVVESAAEVFGENLRRYSSG